jgi:ribosomal-protein-alanine N-acetyltransferase
VSITIAPVGDEAVALLARLHAAAFPAEPWNEAAFAGLLAMRGAFALVAAQDGTPAGLVLARVAADEAEIVTLGVVPQARRRGIGRQLAAAAAAGAAERGAARLFLEVAAANDAARRLYDTLGFQEIGRRPRYYPDGADAVVLARPLSPPCAA